MEQILHKCAKTTHVTRAEIQQSKESIRTLAKRYHVNPKTICKWKNRETIHDEKMGKRCIKSTVLSEKEEELLVKARVLTKLPLDDLLVVAREEIKNLSRSALHRCLKRHHVSVLKDEEQKIIKKEFKDYEIGYFHVDTAEIKTQEGKAYLFVGIDRTSKFAILRLYKKKTSESSRDFLNHLITTCPYVIHTILTDNGTEYTDFARLKQKPSGHHAFDKTCQEYSVEHKLTRVKHPWTNGQVERMNRTIKEHTVKKYFYETFDLLKNHLDDFIMAYNFAKKLKTLRYLTPIEFLTQTFLKKPILFKYNPYHYNPGPYN